MSTIQKLVGRLKMMRGRKRVLTIAGAALVLGALLYVRGSGVEEKSNAWFTVKRGDFTVSITEGGSLRAVNEVIIRSEVEGQPRIIKIVPEGTFVKKGDLLVELDSAELRDRKVQQELQVENAQFAYDAAIQDLAIQKSIHESNMKDAELKVLFAESDLEKYIEGDVHQLLKTATNAIFLAAEELKQAEDRLKWTVELKKQDFVTQTELEKDELAKKRAQIALEKAETELGLLTKYDIPKRKLQLQANLDAAKKEMERIRQRGEAAIAQYEQTVSSRKRALDIQKEKLDEHIQQLALTRILAPQDGMVVYPFSESQRYGGSSSAIEEGAVVRQRQELIKLPDTSQMLVEIKVHESYVNQIRPGLTAHVTVDSLPDMSFDAVIRKVGVLPDTTSRYSNPNLKVYATEVLITDDLPDIKPGVSARAEIVITNLHDVITVPIQAVTTLRGKQVCYLAAGSEPVPTPVEVGLYNDKFIEIKSGLREGDRILLAPPLTTDEGPADAKSDRAARKERKEGSPSEGAPANGAVPGPATDSKGAPAGPGGERKREGGPWTRENGPGGAGPREGMPGGPRMREGGPGGAGGLGSGGGGDFQKKRKQRPPDDSGSRPGATE